MRTKLAGCSAVLLAVPWLLQSLILAVALGPGLLSPVPAQAQAGLPPPRPVIITQPQSVFAAEGLTASFTVVATGELLSYQWFHQPPGALDPVPILEATNATLLLTNLQVTADGVYQVVVSNPFGSTFSDPASLLVYPNATGVQLYCRDGKPITNCTVTITLTNSSGYSVPKIANNPAGNPGDNWFWTCFNCAGGLDPNETWWFLVTASCCTNAWTIPITHCYGNFDGLICDSCGDCPLPRLTCPRSSNLIAPCAEPCLPFTYPNPTVLSGTFAGCTPPSGSCFSLGTTTVTCTATNQCGDTASCEFTVTVKPCLICPKNKTVECGSPWDFDPPTVEQGCAPIQFGVLSTTTNGLCPQIITRTWSVILDCAGGLGLVTQCQQSISVVDTTPPVLVCAPDKSVTCGDDWSFDAPSFLDDGCSPISVQVVGTVTNFPCTAQASIVRTWMASDACGNMSQCSQTVYQAQDAPPVVVCPPDKSVECNLDWTFDPPIVRFACSFPTVTVLGTATNGACPVKVTRVWQIDDPCGHRVVCSQTVTLLNASSLQTPVTIFSGRNPSGLLPLGAPDNQFTFSCLPPGISVPTPVVVQPHPLWLPNSPASQWIGPSANNSGPGGTYCYQLDFELPRCPVGNPVYALKGRWAGDDTGTIHLNGSPTGVTLPAGWAFTNWHPISITSGLVPGFNSLTFYLTNGSDGPTGLRLELAVSALCCDCTNLPCVVTIRCPSNLTNETCDASAVVNYLAPAAASTCGPITNLVCVPPSGATFPLGPTTVTCTAADAQGHAASCSFTVLVTAASSPWQVVCPPLNQSVIGCPPVMPDLTTQVAILTNCPLACPITVTQSIPAGTVLTPGQHVVILRVCDCTGRCFDCDVIITAAYSPDCCNAACTPTRVLNLFSGHGASGLLPGGSTDPQFATGAPLFTTANPYVPAAIHWLWLPNGPNSRWIGPVPNFQGSTIGEFIYTNRFFLCSTQQATLTGRWAGDDAGEIWLNGMPTGNPLPNGWAFLNWTPVSITSGFVPGWNELTFRVTNSLGGSVTGMRVELTGSACCNQCVSIACPPNITTNTCASGTVVSWTMPPGTSSQCGPISSITCNPPSGSAFPPGTSTVNCTAIDTCGNAANCSFTVVVRPGAPPPVVRCPPNRTIVTCGPSAVAYYNAIATGGVGPVICTPPSGSTFPIGTTTVTCSTSNACGLTASCSFKVTVKRYHVGPPWWTWPCDPALLADGLPHVPLNGATLSVGPVPDLPGIGLIGEPPSYHLAPAPDGTAAAVAIHTGNAQLFAFTTVLDIEVPDGATIEITDPTDPAGVPLLTLQKGTGGSGWNCKTCCHWDLKKCKGLISDDPAFRTSAVNPEGELLGSFDQTFNEGNTNAALSLWVTEEDDQTKFPVTILFDRTDGTIHVDFPGTVMPAGVRDSRRKGWDGVVNSRPPGSARLGWDGTVKGRPPEASRVTFTPFKPHAVQGEVMHVVASGLDECLLTAATIGIMGDPKTGQPIIPVRSGDKASPQPFMGPFRSTARGDGVQWTALADDVGVTLDLGRALGVDVAFEHTAPLLPPDGEESVEFRVGARGVQPLALINRPAPPPPTTYLRLTQGPVGVQCTADFSYLAATEVTVQFRRADELIGQSAVKGPAITADDKILLDRWPARFAQLNVSGVLRLAGEFNTASGPADEIRFVPTIPPGVELPDHLSVLECAASAGVDGLLRDLRSIPACAPVALQITRDPIADGIVLDWAGAGYRLQGAETVTGPWLELGGTAPVSLPAGAPLRAFRLVCE